MPDKPLILIGSSRRNSYTRRAVQQLFGEQDVQVVELQDYTLHHYSYSGHYPPDDQMNEVVQLLLQHPVLVFATPVYWYAMSGFMKIFFDRLTDLVTIQKQLGRQLKGKQLFMVAVGAEAELPAGFEVPFERTASYFNMWYKGGIYCIAKGTSYVQTEEQRTFAAGVLAAAATGIKSV